MKNLVQISVFKEYPKIGPKELYSFIVEETAEWLIEDVMADIIEQHGKYHYALWQYLEKINDDGTINLNGCYGCLDYYDLDDDF